MIRLYLNNQTIEIPFEEPVKLSTLLEQYAFPMPCAGNRTCGKCRVTAYGALSPLCAEEYALLSDGERIANTRLACCTWAQGNCAVYVRPAQTLQVAAAGISAIKSGPSPFGETGWAFAADIGTTTVAAYLINLGQADTPRAIGAANAQAAFGADVISRIARCAEVGVKPLQQAILNQLDDLFSALLQRENISQRLVRGAVLTGNTTMLHLLAGLDPAGIATAPYTPESLFGVMYAARGRLHSLPPTAQLYLAPCISAFVGADTVCAVVASAPKPWELLIDVGTNGELALVTDAGLLCCSTAAGPAFEGAGLQCGTPAAAGAIRAVAVEDGSIVPQTIGGGPPTGLCGTGAVSLLAALLETGALDETGRLDEQYDGQYPLTPEIVLTQRDIRNLQLAKAAIAAGIDTLLEQAGLLPEQINKLYIAGGFGGAIDPATAARIGLIPAALADRTVGIGNAAGMGACMIAASQAALDEAERVINATQAVDLGKSAYFNERFIEQMLFPDE